MLKKQLLLFLFMMVLFFTILNANNIMKVNDVNTLKRYVKIKRDHYVTKSLSSGDFLKELRLLCVKDVSAACFDVGTILMKKRIDDSILYFQKGCYLGNRDSCFGLAGVYNNIKKKKDLAEQYYRFACVMRDTRACTALGTLLYLRGDIKGAMYNFKLALANDNNNFSAWYNLACVLAVQKNIVGSTQALIKAVQGDRKYLKEAQSDHDFDNIRNTEIFQKTMKILKGEKRCQ